MGADFLSAAVRLSQYFLMVEESKLSSVSLRVIQKR